MTLIMNTKQLIALSAVAAALLGAAGAASAQTVPAETWVGAPISTSGSTLSRADVRNELTRTHSVARAPQEEWIGLPVAANVAVGSLSRAEVKADLALWNQAGLNQFSAMDSVDGSNPVFRQRTAAYERLRNSPAYLAEVQHQQGAATPSVASTQPATSNGN